MIIQANKLYRTKEGIAVIIYRTDAPGKFPVHGSRSIADALGECLPIAWEANGKYWASHEPHKNDLVEVKPLVRVDMWCAIGAQSRVCYSGYETLDEAKFQMSKIPKDAPFTYIHVLREEEMGHEDKQ